MFENIDRYPRKVGEHWRWGDYIECCCLNSVDKLITKSDLYDMIQENRDSNRDSDEQEDLSSAEMDDRLMAHIDERFNFLATRSCLFPEVYPFQIASDQSTVSLRCDPNQLSKYAPYLFLLISSGLRYIGRDYRHGLTSMFEKVSANALQNLLGNEAEVHMFSAQNNDLPTTAWSKIGWLSEQLQTTCIARPEEFAGNNAGEGGLDIVAWLPTGDRLCNRPLYFVQAACSPDEWPKKVIESSNARWNKILLFSNPSANMMFIPHSYRDSGDNFPKHYNVGDAILFDRSRILRYFSDADMLLSEPSIKACLEQLIH